MPVLCTPFVYVVGCQWTIDYLVRVQDKPKGRAESTSSMLATAYLARSAVPFASALPSILSVVAYHCTSALWYAARAPRILQSQRVLTWSPIRSPVQWKRSSTTRVVRASAASALTTVAWVASTAFQWPLSCPCASALPFVACCVLGLERSIGSNVMLLFQTLLLVVAVVFDNALLLPFMTTTASLIGFGVTASRADPVCFFLGGVAHVVLALLGSIALVQTSTSRQSMTVARADALSACFCAVMCAEARVRAATTVVCARQRVMWACRAAVVGCVPALAFRGLAEKKMLETPHIATAALACAAACSPWFWNVHRAWRTQHISPPQIMNGEALMLAVVFLCLLLLAFALPTVNYFALQ